jgi:glycosyltransferase involved in cell wall biosynthesis
MRILFAHNAYQHRGGEDSVVEAEVALLRSHGHAVETYTRSNDDVGGMSSLALARQTLWSDRTMRELARLIGRFQPDVIHAHNTFPLISPSLYWAASACHVPVVQTLHNFRLLCPQAMLLREGKVCEDCIGKLPWRGAVRRCYRESLPQSAGLVAMLGLHRALGTYAHKVSRFIALNDFCREVFVRGGLPADRLRVKPNFVPDPGVALKKRSGMLFVGRLSHEKGVSVLVDALRSRPNLICEVIGTGPEEGRLTDMSGVTLSGWRQVDYILERMQSARALVMPSLCYENFPRALVEAFACGLPVIASRLGAMAALVRDGETGLLFEPGNAVDLADKLMWADTHPDEMARMGETARREYEQNYTPQRNLEILLDIYADAITANRGEA